MGPSDFFFLGTALLALIIALRRTRIAEDATELLVGRLDAAEKEKQRLDPLVTLGLLAREPEYTRVDVVELARVAHRRLAAHAYARGVRVHAVLEPVPTVLSGMIHLEKALEHLLLAALDADSADVTLAVGEIDDCVLISVADDADRTGSDENRHTSAAALADKIGAELVRSGDGRSASLRLPVAGNRSQVAGSCD